MSNYRTCNSIFNVCENSACRRTIVLELENDSRDIQLGSMVDFLFYRRDQTTYFERWYEEEKMRVIWLPCQMQLFILNTICDYQFYATFDIFSITNENNFDFLHFAKQIFEICGAKVAPNAIFIMIKNVENSLKRNFCLKTFLVERIEREIRPFIRKGEWILIE